MNPHPVIVIAIAGAELFRRRCQAVVMILSIVAVALIVLETGFRGK